MKSERDRAQAGDGHGEHIRHEMEEKQTQRRVDAAALRGTAAAIAGDLAIKARVQSYRISPRAASVQKIYVGDRRA